ncbi:hypothetical protein EES44_24705 [Streptomyces sp. ADI96-15]|nr:MULTISPECIES: hypothetical protein [Streptomyces]MDH6189210.1 hypothetical protein [Streptomyces sp. CZ24]RPK57932.1 hypothetical protein EES44_24705 [Streptomyces sp. ADI96-15]
MSKNVTHDARTCPMCAPLRHPSQLRTRRALAALPRQSAESAARETGGNR